ncbi:MAG: mechanosensitive ion channel [Candidatus ainarchaeum sp.]|nr:mechanosensitive ion channel [Candidatus ainarchaeum sp.]
MFEEIINITFFMSLLGFAFSFIALLMLWAFFSRIIEMTALRTKMTFLTNIIKEVQPQIIAFVSLISLYVGIFIFDNSILEHQAFKLWSIAIILISVNVLFKIISSVFEHYGKNIFRVKFTSRALFAIKTSIAVILYFIAFLLIIDLFSPQLSIVLVSFGILLLLLIFIIYYTEIKDIIAGFRIYNRFIRPGDFVCLGRLSGYIIEITGRTTVVKDIHGRNILIPNSYISSNPITNFSNAGGNIWVLNFTCSCTDLKKFEKHVLLAFSNSLSKCDGLLRGFRPVIRHIGFDDSRDSYTILFQTVPFAEIALVKSVLANEINNELKKNKIKTYSWD